jgi:hypothetical protein
MPAKRHRYINAIQRAPWVEGLDSDCLRATVTEALLAYETAVRAGGDEKIIESGEKTLEAIEFHRVEGETACKRAATAIRKFDQAYMGAYRKKYGHSRRLQHRYGKSAAFSPVVRWETRAVLAGAYRGNHRGMGQRDDRATRTHLVGIDAAGNDVRVKCRGVQLDNLADPNAGNVNAAPTCPRCAGLAR